MKTCKVLCLLAFLAHATFQPHALSLFAKISFPLAAMRQVCYQFHLPEDDFPGALRPSPVWPGHPVCLALSCPSGIFCHIIAGGLPSFLPCSLVSLAHAFLLGYTAMGFFLIFRNVPPDFLPRSQCSVK